MAENPAANQPTDIGNPKDVQGIVAVATVVGFIGVAGAAAIADVIRGVDPTPILNVIAPIAFGVVAFYFGVKSQQ